MSEDAPGALLVALCEVAQLGPVAAILCLCVPLVMAAAPVRGATQRDPASASLRGLAGRDGAMQGVCGELGKCCGEGIYLKLTFCFLCLVRHQQAWPAGVKLNEINFLPEPGEQGWAQS